MLHRLTRRALALVVGTSAIAVTAVGLSAVARADLPSTTQPALTLGTRITTQPFAGSTVSAKDVDGSAYVPGDDALWVVDRRARAVYEVDATTKALRRTIPSSAFTAATRLGTTTPADPTRVDSFSAAAYDAASDSLYVFSGFGGGNASATPPVPNNPTAFRLTRVAGAFQVQSWQPLPEDTTGDADGAAYRPGAGLYLARGTRVRSYDYATNTVGTTGFQLSGTATPVVNIRGLSFSADGASAYVVADGTHFYRASVSTAGTWPLQNGWDLDLAALGVLDARSVDVVGSRLYVADSADTRATTDPNRWAVFGIDVRSASAAPVAGFTRTPASGPGPLDVTFTDTTTGEVTSRSWDFGDGTASTLVSPAHTYTDVGTYAVRLTATGPGGTSVTTSTVTVTAVLPVARFVGTPSGAQVAFTNESTESPTTWAWDFGDGATSTARTPSHVYAADGAYTVSLTATNGAGANTRVRSGYVTVSGGVARVADRNALPDIEGPGVRLSRTIAAAPFRGSSTSARDDEGSAYVPGDGSLWLTDDTADRVYEVDAVNGRLRRTVATSAFTAAPALSGGAQAGASRADDLGSAAYDPSTDSLYVFSGSCCGTAPFQPTAFRLKRDGGGAFQVESWQPLPEGTDPTGAAYRAGAGLSFVKGQTLRSYDYGTNTVGASRTVTGVDVGLTGAAYTHDGTDLVLVSQAKRLYRVAASTNAVRPGWSVDLTPFGILDPRAVEVVDGQIYVSDGADTRASDDPLRYAVFVFDVVDATAAPGASFTRTPTSGGAPHDVQFTDTSTGAPRTWAWDFGDGRTSTLQSPAHLYSEAGTYTVRLTVANAKGSDTATLVDAVTVTPNSPLLAARFGATPTTGSAPLAVQFTDDSTGDVTTRAWDFGDGTTSTQRNPVKTYTAPGTYTVRLTVTTADGRTNTRVRTDHVRVGSVGTTLGTAADTWVRSDVTTSANGSAATMRGKVSASATYQPYFRFSVGALDKAPTGARLRLYVTDNSDSTGTLYRTEAGWSESALTWASRPAVVGSPVAAAKPAPVGTWVELDVSLVVTGPGEYAFTLADPPANAVAFASKESGTAANRPQLVLSFAEPVPSAGGLPMPEQPALRLNRYFTAAPFSGTTTTARDLEGSAYVPRDGSLWLSEDNTSRIYEVDARTSLLKRVIPASDLLNAVPVGGVGEPAGPQRTDDMESMAYDPATDTLYAFAGNCCGTAPFKPTAFRLKRDAAGDFQVESYQPLPEGTDNTGLGWRPGHGLYGVHSNHVTDYDYATNTVGTELTLPGFDGPFVGLTFTEDGKYAVATTKNRKLYLLDASTWTAVPGWSFDLAPYGILDPRAVEIVDGQLWVSDGYDFRDASDPMRYVVVVFDVVRPLPASFTAAPTSGPAPLTVTFTDTTSGDVTARQWDLGDGTTATTATVARTYTAPGIYTVSLTATGPSGASTVTKTGLVTVTDAPAQTELRPTADTYARSDRPTTSYGSATTVSGRVLADGQYQPYLRFTVPSQSRPITKAVLRMYVTDASDATGPVWTTASATWAESALTWNTRPATAVQVAPSQRVVVGQWVEFDVTSAVTGAGDHGFVLPATSTNAVGFASTQDAAGNGPRLVLTSG